MTEHRTAHLSGGCCKLEFHQTMASEFGLSSPMQQRKRLSQISGLLAASIDNSSLVNNHIDNDQDDAQGISTENGIKFLQKEYALYRNISIQLSIKTLNFFRKEKKAFTNSYQIGMGFTLSFPAYIQKCHL